MLLDSTGSGGGRGGGVVEAVPERFDGFDAVFVCYFPGMEVCIKHATIHIISSDFGDRMTTQSIELMVLSEHF